MAKEFLGLGPNSSVTISFNVLSNNVRGVKVGLNALTGSVQAYRNSLTANSAFGFFKDPSSGGSVVGTCNWWNSRNGPGPVGPSTTGDKVTAGVSFSPWLTSSNLDGKCGSKNNDDD